MEGALRILRALLTEDGVSTDTAVDHINYLIQISVFAQSNPWINVLQYDRVYREEQHAYGFKWGTGSPFLMTTHLQRPAQPSSDKSRRTRPQQILDPKSGKPVCLRFDGQRYPATSHHG